MKKVIIITLVLLTTIVSACTTNTKREVYPPRVSAFIKSYYSSPDTELQEVDFRGHLYIIARCGNNIAIIHSDNCDCMIDYD